MFLRDGLFKKLLLHLKFQLCLGLWARQEQAVPGMRLTGKQNCAKEKKSSCQAGDGKGGSLA